MRHRKDIIDAPVAGTPLDSDDARVVERPDGFYWQSRSGREYGPFATLLEALQDKELWNENALEPGETLEEAEAEVGIPGGIDPESGEPAEIDGPHLEEH
jgi:hypothetical protein